MVNVSWRRLKQIIDKAMDNSSVHVGLDTDGFVAVYNPYSNTLTSYNLLDEPPLIDKIHFDRLKNNLKKIKKNNIKCFDAEDAKVYNISPSKMGAQPKNRRNGKKWDRYSRAQDKLARKLDNAKRKHK